MVALLLEIVPSATHNLASSGATLFLELKWVHRFPIHNVDIPFHTVFYI